jgi:hypothetical protein
MTKLSSKGPSSVKLFYQWLSASKQALSQNIHCSIRDVHESVHCDTIMKATNKMQLYRLIYFSLSALHISGDVFAHHQEHLTVCTLSGSIQPGCCRLNTTNYCKYSPVFLMMGENIARNM